MGAFRLFAVYAYYKQECFSNLCVQLCLHLCCISCSWQRTQEDLQQLRSEFDVVSTKCNSFLHQSPSGSSVPSLRSELNLLVEKIDHVYGLSTVYLNKWVSWGFGSKGRYFHFVRRAWSVLWTIQRGCRSSRACSHRNETLALVPGNMERVHWGPVKKCQWHRKGDVAVLGLFCTSFLFV